MKISVFLILSCWLVAMEARSLRRTMIDDEKAPVGGWSIQEMAKGHRDSRHLEGSWETITYDDFENENWGSLADGGSDARIVSKYAHQGSYSLRLRDNSKAQSSAYQHSDHDVTQYSDLKVSFWFYPYSMETNEDFFLEYSADGGSTWSVVKSWARGRDFDDEKYYSESVRISEPDFNLATTKARLRFRCDASSNADQVYLDEIQFQGFAVKTPSPSQSPTKSQAPSEAPSGFPSDVPSAEPSSMPSTDPTSVPSFEPSLEPSTIPSSEPSLSVEPSLPLEPSSDPSSNPSDNPSTAPSDKPSKSPTVPLTCPDGYCGSSSVTTMDPQQCNHAGIAAVQLDAFTHEGLDLVELLGPSNPSNAAAVVISVPHGGFLEPNSIATRSTSHSSCPCVTTKDTNTIEIAMLIVERFIHNYCKVPYVVLNNLHRSKLDANRDIEEAAQGDPIAESAFHHFHDFIADAQNRTLHQMGRVVNSVGVEGARGLLLDLHGYGGYEWNADNGGPFIQWGYRLSDSMLNLNTPSNCPIDSLNLADPTSIGTFTHACELPGQSYECLARGPGSLGSRVASKLSGMGTCGIGLPSYEFPNPYDTERDPSYCANVPCTYFRGGYDVDVHEHLDWRTRSGIKFNAVQAELPRCIRFSSNGRFQIAEVLSIEMCSFLRDIFPDDPNAPMC